MKLCAFCPRGANTGEHIWSDWINRALGATDQSVTWSTSDNPAPKTWRASKMKATLPVLCNECNNGWLSDLEYQRWQPSLAPFMLSLDSRSVGPEQITAM